MIIVWMIIVGLCLGSFVTALVWRLHEQTLKVSKARRNQLSIMRGRSICPHCGHKLAALDLIPVVSYLMLRGKCRYCHRPVSGLYPLTELLTVALVLLSYFFWPLPFGGSGTFEFVVWMMLLTGLIALAVYDAQWSLLPNKIVYPLLVLTVLQAIIVSTLYKGGVDVITGAIWGTVIIGGLFYIIFQVSRGEWIGGGDVKLGALLGLIASGPMSAVLLLLVASTSGTLYSLPLILSGKAKRNSRIPFGPFLIIGGIVVRLFGASLVGWYKRHLVS